MPCASIVESETGAARAAVRAAVAEQSADEEVSRLVVVPATLDGADAFFAQVLAALMVTDRLDIEVAYVPPGPTSATRVHGLPHGDAARRAATAGRVRNFPLIRDDAGTVLVGSARHLGADGAKLHGETYIDNDRLFTGEVHGVRIEPTGQAPGLRGRLDRPGLKRRWYVGRAAQTGGTNIVVEREGVVSTRVVRRSTFYRHHADMRLVCR